MMFNTALKFFPALCGVVHSRLRFEVETVTTRVGITVLATSLSLENISNDGRIRYLLDKYVLKPTGGVRGRNCKGGEDLDTSIRITKPLLFSYWCPWLFSNC